MLFLKNILVIEPLERTFQESLKFKTYSPRKPENRILLCQLLASLIRIRQNTSSWTMTVSWIPNKAEPEELKRP